MKESRYIKKLKERGEIPEYEESKKTLEKLGIKSIYALDELGEDPDEYNFEDELKLLIIPLNTGVHQDSTVMKNRLRENGLPAKEKYYPCLQEIEINDRETVYPRETYMYFKSRNLIVATCNPFYDKKISAWFIKQLESMAEYIEYLDPKEAIFEELATKMNERIHNDLKNNRSKTDQLEVDIETAGNIITDSIQEKEVLKKIREVLEQQLGQGKQVIKEQIKLLKENKLLKEVKIERQGITIDFGEIFIYGKVKTGVNKNKEGVEVPIIEMRKVRIGEICVRIDGKDLVCWNKQGGVGNNAHPHAHQNGNLCLGGIRNKVSEAIAKMELITVAKLLFSWVRSYNEGDCFSKLQNFYDHEQKQKKIDEENYEED